VLPIRVVIYNFTYWASRSSSVIFSLLPVIVLAKKETGTIFYCFDGKTIRRKITSWVFRLNLTYGWSNVTEQFLLFYLNQRQRHICTKVFRVKHQPMFWTEFSEQEKAQTILFLKYFFLEVDKIFLTALKGLRVSQKEL